MSQTPGVSRMVRTVLWSFIIISVASVAAAARTLSQGARSVAALGPGQTGAWTSTGKSSAAFDSPRG